MTRRPLRAALLTLALILAGTPAAAAPPEVLLQISPRGLPQALIELGRQADISIVFATDSALDRAAPRLAGVYRIDEALDILLADTQLVARFIEDRVVSIARACADPGGCAEPPAPLRLDDPNQPPIEQLTVIGRYLTGSRIRRFDEGGASPVQVIGAPDVELTGAQTLGEILKFLPEVAGNATSTAISNGGDGTATVTLRGLPASNTLVLVNGRRMANDGLAGDAFDLNILTPAMVDRLEIVTTGASAVYGSDAIAGVVNVILKRDFEGVEVGTYLGQTTRTDLETTSTHVTWGRNLRHGNVLLSLARFEQQPLFSRARALSRSADGRPLGGADLRSSATPQPRVAVNGDTFILAQAADSAPKPDSDATDFRPASDEDLYDYRSETVSVVPSERSSLFGSVQYDLNDQVTAFAELAYAATSSASTLAPTPLFTGFEALPLPIAATQAFNPFDTAISDLRRRLEELGPRRQLNDADAGQFAIGLKLTSPRWQHNLTMHWSRSEAKERHYGVVDGLALRLGLGPPEDCPEADCIPINVFGPPGSINPEQATALAADLLTEGYSQLNAFSWSSAGSWLRLPQGYVELAGGIEFREESTALHPDPLQAAGHVIGANNRGGLSGTRSTGEAYLEMLVPVLGGWTALKRFDLEMAGRYSRYSDFGGVATGKIGFRYQPIAELLVRGAWTEGFRAPTLAELNAVESQSFAFLDDPCSRSENVGTLPGCTQQADPLLLQVLTVSGGNSELDAEKANSYALGMRWQPRAIPGFSASIDAFHLDQRRAVDANAQYTVDANAQGGAFADQVWRDERGNLTRVIASTVNVGGRELSGIDLAARYRFPDTRLGRLKLTVDASHLLEFRSQLGQSGPVVDLTGTFVDPAAQGLGALPEWKANAGLTWRRGRWEGRWDLHYVSSMQETIPDTETTRSIRRWLTHDLQVSRLFKVYRGLRFAVGIDNVFDEAPPFVASAFNDNYDGRSYDLEGRYVYARLLQRL
jgi:iron complex outermembrane receptor protein